MKNKKLLKGIKDAKEGKITIVRTVKDIFKKDKREKYLYYRVYLYFYRLFWQLVRLSGDVRRTIRDFIQRGRRGYANSDTWGFAYYLSKVISGGVKHLEKIQHGMPTWTPGKTELESQNEWDCILNTIINTFEIAKYIANGKIYYIPSTEFTEKKYKKMKKSIEKTNQKYKRHDNVLTLKESKEFEKGFDLFKKYFFSLWD